MIRTMTLVLLLFAATALAQDDADETPEPETESSEDNAIEGIDDDILIDTQDHTEEDDDVFVPTDEVSFQQSVPFPTDI